MEQDQSLEHRVTPESKYDTANKPFKRLQAGGGVSVAVWRNTGTRLDGTPSEWYSVTLQRAYKDRSEAWRYTTASLRMRDLLPAAMALQQAYREVMLKTYDNTAATDAAPQGGEGDVMADWDELPF